MRKHIGLAMTTILRIKGPDGRVRRFRGHNTVTDYGLFLTMQAVFGAIVGPSMAGTAGTVSLGPATRYNDSSSVYPSLYDLGGNMGGAANPWTNQSGVGTGILASSYNGLMGGSTGLLLVATSDASAPSETQFTWPANTTCVWSSTASTVSTSAANQSWTTSGSTSGATPPQAKFVLSDSATATSALTIQSMGWTGAFTLGSVAGATAPTAQPAPTPAWTSGTPTDVGGWPIFSKVIPSGAPIAVASGSTMAATYIFTLTT